jgi:protease-4
LAGVLIGGFSLILIIGAVVMSDDGGFTGVTGDRIAVIPIEGVIDGAMAKRINRQLKQYGDDRHVKAIVLRIDSPGGGVAPSRKFTAR